MKLRQVVVQGSLLFAARSDHHGGSRAANSADPHFGPCCCGDPGKHSTLGSAANFPIVSLRTRHLQQTLRRSGLITNTSLLSPVVSTPCQRQLYRVHPSRGQRQSPYHNDVLHRELIPREFKPFFFLCYSWSWRFYECRNGITTLPVNHTPSGVFHSLAIRSTLTGKTELG